MLIQTSSFIICSHAFPLLCTRMYPLLFEQGKLQLEEVLGERIPLNSHTALITSQCTLEIHSTYLTNVDALAESFRTNF